MADEEKAAATELVGGIRTRLTIRLSMVDRLRMLWRGGVLVTHEIEVSPEPQRILEERATVDFLPKARPAK